jgi:hypothetical protein
LSLAAALAGCHDSIPGCGNGAYCGPPMDFSAVVRADMSNDDGGTH